MVLNPKKYHYMCFGIGSENGDFVFDAIKLPNSCEEKVLGVIIDNEFKFDPYIRSMCKHGTIIRTGITCKKIPCYMRDSACRWFIVENTKIFRGYVKHF